MPFKLSEKFLEKLRHKRVFLMGVGHRLRGDDAVGSLLAERLAAKYSQASRLKAVDCGPNPENHIRSVGDWNAAAVVIVDAVDMGETPGTVRVVECDEIRETGFSTHNFPLNVIMDRIRERFDVDVWLVGIQPEKIELGETLSPAVEKALDDLAAWFSSLSADG